MTGRRPKLAIVENLQRKDLNPLEKAASFEKYLERYQCTQEELARRLSARPLDRGQLDPPAGAARRRSGTRSARRDYARTRPGALAAGRRARAGRVLPAHSTGVAERARGRGACRASAVAADAPQTLRLVTGEPEPRASRRRQSQHTASLEQQFRAALGTKVDVRETARGRGRIVIHFKNHEEFERLQAQLCGGQQRRRATWGEQKSLSHCGRGQGEGRRSDRQRAPPVRLLHLAALAYRACERPTWDSSPLPDSDSAGIPAPAAQSGKCQRGSSYARKRDRRRLGNHVAQREPDAVTTDLIHRET